MRFSATPEDSTRRTSEIPLLMRSIWSSAMRVIGKFS
jgi:hypothetical protein